MASFDGTSFLERGEGGTNLPYWAAEAPLNVILIPNGAPVIQGGGRNPQTMEIPIRATTSQINALRGKVGTSGSLVHGEGTTTAILQGLNSPVRLMDGLDIWFATLKFMKVG